MSELIGAKCCSIPIVRFATNRQPVATEIENFYRHGIKDR